MRHGPGWDASFEEDGFDELGRVRLLGVRAKDKRTGTVVSGVLVVAMVLITAVVVNRANANKDAPQLMPAMTTDTSVPTDTSAPPDTNVNLDQLAVATPHPGQTMGGLAALLATVPPPVPNTAPAVTPTTLKPTTTTRAPAATATTVKAANVASYTGSMFNINTNQPSTIRMTGVTEDAQGRLSGQMAIGAPYNSTTAFGGVVGKDSSVSFSINDTVHANTFQFTGKLTATGMSGTFDMQSPAGAQTGTWSANLG